MAPKIGDSYHALIHEWLPTQAVVLSGKSLERFALVAFLHAEPFPRETACAENLIS